MSSNSVMSLGYFSVWVELMETTEVMVMISFSAGPANNCKGLVSAVL